MPDPTPEDWYRLLTVALLATEPLPFKMVNGVALARRGGLTIFLEKKEPGIAEAIQSRFSVSSTPQIREIGPITPIAQGGDSVDTGAGSLPGSLGGLVKDANNTRYFLTCDHVVGQLAGRNVNDPVYSGGSQIGNFARGGTVNMTSGAQNRIDAALISLLNPTVHSSSIRRIGRVNGTVSWSLGERVNKYGARTWQTIGDYVYQVSHRVPYGAGTALFVDQIGVASLGSSPFADAGDSGSLVFDRNGNVGGLIFASAVNSNLGFANPIDDVLQHFGVAFV
jgi:hypothetical protein